jgi:S-DNA-T family DNA segregation ATPase FtsK/SpoIIIE
VHALRGAVRVDEEPWVVPVGIAESDLGRAALTLYEGEHALIAGPARSGRSTALQAIAATLRAGSAVHLAGLGGRRSPLRECGALDEVAGTAGEAAALLARLRTVGGPVALLIDDAETLDDADGAIDLLLKAEIPGLHAFVAGGNDTLRSLYGHWTKTVRRSRTGILLRPNVDLDGDLLGTTLPRRAPVALSVPGRGYLVAGGETRVVQVAAP